MYHISLTHVSPQFDLTRRTGLMMIIALVATLGLIILIVVMLFTQIRVLQAVIALIGTLLISMVYIPKNINFSIILISTFVIYSQRFPHDNQKLPSIYQ